MSKPRRPFRSPEAVKSALKRKYESVGKRCFEVPNPPPILYHYCREEVLKIILSTGKLWASDVFCMNDKSEITYAFSDIVGHIVSETGADGLPKYYIKSVKPAEIVRELWSNFCTHIACFSATSEIPSQWLNYAKCTGCAIGFDQSALKNYCLQRGITLLPMSYQRPNQEKTIREFLDGVRNIEVARNLSEDCLARKELREQANVYLASLAMTLKEKTWCREEEWRILVIQKDNETSFKRLTREDIFQKCPDPARGVCYFELPICTPAIIAEVVLGPSYSSNAEALKRWLTEIGLSSVGVRRSLCQCPETDV